MKTFIHRAEAKFNQWYSFRALVVWALLTLASAAANRAAEAEDANHHATPAGLGATNALTALIDGNKRFYSASMTHPRQGGAEIVPGLQNGQSPWAVILTCSDSRVSPEVVFDQGLGDLFVIRNAGNVADATALASIEYATAHLGCKLVVVMGHQKCGAVTAAMLPADAPTVTSEPMELQNLLTNIRAKISGVSTNYTADERLTQCVYANALLQVQAMGPPRAAGGWRRIYDAQKVQVVPAVYDLKTGKVTFQPSFLPGQEEIDARIKEQGKVK